MANTVTTSQAVRIMGVWVRRADAMLADRALENAAYAVSEERERADRLERDLASLDPARDALPRAI